MINLTLRERRLVAVALLLLLICVLLFAIITYSAWLSNPQR
jgi:hypothetical protein